MKRKLIVVILLVLICFGALVVEGVTQPPEPAAPPPQADFSPRRSLPKPPPAPPSPIVSGPSTAQNFSVVLPQQQEWTFEQLVEALKAVRARQKDLQTQEADLLAKMEKKIEEKRQDLSQSEATLQQLRAVNGRVYPPKEDRMDMIKSDEKKR